LLCRAVDQGPKTSILRREVAIGWLSPTLGWVSLEGGNRSSCMFPGTNAAFARLSFTMPRTVPMAFRQHQPAAESRRRFYSSAPPYLDIQKHLGKALREQYKPPKELPHGLFTLLLQISEPEDNK
jgi:hypothetical protein